MDTTHQGGSRPVPPSPTTSTRLDQVSSSFITNRKPPQLTGSPRRSEIKKEPISPSYQATLRTTRKKPRCVRPLIRAHHLFQSAQIRRKSLQKCSTSELAQATLVRRPTPWQTTTSQTNPLDISRRRKTHRSPVGNSPGTHSRRRGEDASSLAVVARRATPGILHTTSENVAATGNISGHALGTPRGVKSGRCG